MAAKRVLVVAHGSRGDAQPMVAFAKALQDGGFAVRVVTDPDHCDLFSHMGLSVVGSGTYSLTQELREDPGMRSSMESGDFPTFAKALAESNKRNYPESIRISLNEIDTFKPDLITSGALDSVDLLAIATAKGIPYRFSGLQCGYPSMFATSFLGEPESAPGRVHLACGYAMMKLWLKGETEIKVPVLKEQCPEAVQYWPNYNAFVQINAFNSATQPLLFLSPSLNQRRADWPETVQPIYAGASVIAPEQQAEQLSKGTEEWGGEDRDRMEAFLAAGRAPVYMGWGSMVSGSADRMAQLAVRTLMKLGERGIILGGVAQLSKEMLNGQPDSAEMHAYVEANCIFLKTAPHEVLFPRCSVIVHHGGSGTTAAGLRSGNPSIVTPVWIDQYPNGLTVQNSGAGIRMKHFSKVTVEDLSEAVKTCLENREVRNKARMVAAQLKAENGAAVGVEEFKRFLAEDVATGKYAERIRERTQWLQAIKAKRDPSCFAWLGHICCSASPNTYRMKGSSKAVGK